MKRIALLVALTLVLVLSFSTVAMAAAGGNNNPLGTERSSYAGAVPFGQAQSAWVAVINSGSTQWSNYGDYLGWWKLANGFK